MAPHRQAFATATGEQRTHRGASAVFGALAAWVTGALGCPSSAPPAPGEPGSTDPSTSSSTTGSETSDGSAMTFTLRIDPEPQEPLRLQLDREQVHELFGASADSITLLELDPTPLLTHALEALTSACGTMWTLDDPDPGHDCSVTALGQSFSGPDGTWQTSSEYALVRVLTMTPANVDVTGTSSEALRGLADALNIGGGYSEILASALGIARTEPIVSTQALATALRRDFVASHPSVGPAATLRVTLADALSDMATLATRYGPEGPHGGILDPAQPPFGVIFTDAFQMEVEAHSNLRLVEGIDADGGKGFLSLLVDTTGPTYEDEVEFDFTDPERFRLQGIAEQLTIDLRVRLDEHSNFIASCLGEPPCQANAPGTPVSTASVWAIDPWLLEYNVADAARERYQARTFLGTYLLGAASIRIGLDGNPLGWVQYAVPFDIGSPPEDQYLWETILEVAQTALHEGPFGEVAEGDGDVAFTLDDVQVGLTGAQAVEAARPTLQAQASALSDSLLGDFRENNDPVDFFVWATDDGDPVLMFAAPTDRPPGSPYGYARPGFFSSPELAERTKVSRPSIPGIADTEHEKVVLQSQGSALYFADDSGRVYRLEVLRVHEGSLEVSLEAID